MNNDWKSKICIKTKYFSCRKTHCSAFLRRWPKCTWSICACIKFVRGLHFMFRFLLLLIEFTFQDLSFNLLQWLSSSSFCFSKSLPSTTITVNWHCSLTVLTTNLGLFGNRWIVEINILLPIGNPLKFFSSLLIYPVVRLVWVDVAWISCETPVGVAQCFGDVMAGRWSGERTAARW